MSMEWEKARALLDGAQRIILLTHVSPDGDAIGSMLGLAHAFGGQGRVVVPAVDDGVPEALGFLPGAALIRADLEGIQADLVIAVDCSDERRMGEVGKAARVLGVPLINLDHHRTNTYFGEANLVDPDVASSAECALAWLDQLGIPLTPDVAQCLLCGLVTDTRCFRTSNTTAETLDRARRLMAAGGDLSGIVRRTVSRIPAAVLRLWGRVLPRVRLEDHIVWVGITQEDLRAASVPDGKDGGLPGLLLEADEAYISCVLTETERGIDISMRAEPGFDVSGVALDLGGGGHTLAAGATVPGPLDAVEARLIALLRAAVRAGTPLTT